MTDPGSVWAVVLGAGDPVRCVACHRKLGQFGPGLRVRLRVHPVGRGADPTQSGGFAFTCRGCRTHLDIDLQPSHSTHL